MLSSEGPLPGGWRLNLGEYGIFEQTQLSEINCLSETCASNIPSEQALFRVHAIQHLYRGDSHTMTAPLNPPFSLHHCAAFKNLFTSFFRRGA